MTNKSRKRWTVSRASLVMACLAMNQAFALDYHDSDLLLCFRQKGAAYELVVNLGAIQNLKALAPGATRSITELDTNQIRTAFQSLNEIKWGAVGAVASATSSNYPVRTLWATRARPAVGTRSTPWVRKNATAQATVETRITSIGNGAASLSSQAGADPVHNTATAIIEAAGGAHSYGYYATEAGNLKTFQGVVEKSAPADFETGLTAVQADLYELQPDPANQNQPGTYLGYLELTPRGSLSFTAAGGSVQVAAPQLRVIRQNNATAIEFASQAGIHYFLRGTNAPGSLAPASQWPRLNIQATGDGSVLTVTDPTSEASRFYVIEANP